MKIYFDKVNIPDGIPRKYISDWVKPLYGKPRHSLYGLEPNDLILANSSKDADVFTLPLTWNYYLENDLSNEAESIIKSYKIWQKPIYTWNTGDFSLKIPEGNFKIFKQDCYESLLKINEIPYPVIIRDPLEYLQIKKINIMKKKDKPKVGFCGITESGLLKNQLRLGKQRIKQYLKMLYNPHLENIDLLTGLKLRNQTLALFSESSDIDTIFITRAKSSAHKENIEFKLEFLKNIIDTNYTICVRGSGNFSTRFYETLALGRIPILINTDCSLPLNKIINWKDHCLLIEEHDLKNSAYLLNEYHNNLSEIDFETIQKKNRELWLNKLTFNGFLKSLHAHEREDYCE